MIRQIICLGFAVIAASAGTGLQEDCVVRLYFQQAFQKGGGFNFQS